MRSPCFLRRPPIITALVAAAVVVAAAGACGRTRPTTTVHVPPADGPRAPPAARDPDRPPVARWDAPIDVFTDGLRVTPR